MADSKNSFVVYTDIKETLDGLTDDQVATLFRGMVDYQITGEDPKFSGVLKYVFVPIRQQMDRNNIKWERKKAARAEAGRQGGIRSGEVRRAKAENEANKANASQMKQNEANEANEAVTVNGTVTVNGNGTGTVTVPDELSEQMPPVSTSLSSSVSSIISYLNERTGSLFDVTEQDEERINRILKEGYSLDDMKAVVDLKASEWMDSDKMRRYLRPRTLFGPKFPDYVRGARSNGFLEERERRAAAAETNRARDETVRAMEEERPASGLTEEEKEELRRKFRIGESE